MSVAANKGFHMYTVHIYLDAHALGSTGHRCNNAKRYKLEFLNLQLPP